MNRCQMCTSPDRVFLVGRLKTEKHAEKRRAQEQRAAAGAARAQVEAMRKEAAAGKEALRVAREQWVMHYLDTADAALCVSTTLPSISPPISAIAASLSVPNIVHLVCRAFRSCMSAAELSRTHHSV